MKTKIIVSSIVIVILAVGFWSYSRASIDKITVCVKKSGLVFIINNATESAKQEKCEASDTLLTWNIMGEKGEKGDTGEQGPMGPQGPQGEPGLPAQTGAGNILFSHGGFLLKNDGTVWVTHFPGGPAQYRSWQQANLEDGWNNPNVSPVPIPVNEIVSWQIYIFLDKFGNFWTYDLDTDIWINLGPLP